MSIATAMQSYDLAYKARVDAQTWGHLFPKSSTEAVRGQLRIAQTSYNGVVVLDLEIEIDDSPWWNVALHNFIDDFELELGQVVECLIDVRVVTDIEELPYMSEIEIIAAQDGWDDWLINYAKPRYSERIVIELVEENIVMEGLR